MKHSLLPFLFGMLFGALLAVSVKYPVSINEIDRIRAVCSEGEYSKFRVGITGVIYEVTCKDEKTFSVKEKAAE